MFQSELLVVEGIRSRYQTHQTILVQFPKYGKKKPPWIFPWFRHEFHGPSHIRAFVGPGIPRNLVQHVFTGIILTMTPSGLPGGLLNSAK